MPGRRAILPPAMFALVVTAALSAQAIRTTHAADECLAKPSGPTPQGQHWYYRIDHANNNRQCWRIAPEGLPVQKLAPQTEDRTTSDADAQQQSRAPQAVIAAPARAAADAAPALAANPVAAAIPAPWPEAPQSRALSSTLLSMPSQGQAAPQTASADDTVPVTANDDTPAVTNDPSPAAGERAEQLQSAVAGKPPQPFAGIDRTFALLMVMFGLLAVTGPILHFAHQQRQREVINYKPPQWAPVVPLNTPTPRIRQSQAPEPPMARTERRSVSRPVRAAEPPQPSAWRPAPDPPRPVEPNERLTQALQQLIDRMQTIQPARSDPAPARSRRADIEMLKNAR